ncbi:unnamed protein product [Cyberlindnera jadinii]|uniref:Uncharacterized protein n=1 Tax=Cyberlindnera jadinii (strain ATCC 18201 / CBS 1600 / BCRC 20928 / JCM 3617 / NBRC 0987 / NRRL Y-1542) TaxID=983966 RepID=A0A0H5CBE5_CYBJN|nr:unnamed protein product [Cyberlindnera jadinii]
MNARHVLKLKNVATAARIRLPNSRTLAMYNTQSQFRLVNKDVPKEQQQQKQTSGSSKKTTSERPTIYSEGEVETAGPHIRL